MSDPSHQDSQVFFLNFRQEFCSHFETPINSAPVSAPQSSPSGTTNSQRQPQPAAPQFSHPGGNFAPNYHAQPPNAFSHPAVGWHHGHGTFHGGPPRGGFHPGNFNSHGGPYDGTGFHQPYHPYPDFRPHHPPHPNTDPIGWFRDGPPPPHHPSYASTASFRGRGNGHTRFTNRNGRGRGGGQPRGGKNVTILN